ncbi:CBASS cGAMP synthase [Roseateles sp. LYH14W]|uniref:Cyclic GMP-AMP synthase n=1 Tax=Pelomonas parva TaxID=3299032 RepID=A0ABW7F7L7_9BURK
MGQASTLFNGNVEQTLIARVSPTAAQREFLQSSWNTLADHLRSSLKAKHGYTISTWLQGSYKYGTLIKPVHPDEAYDVDLGVYFEWEGDEDVTPTAQQLRTWVQEEIKLFAGTCEDLKSVSEPPKPRCSRANYVRQFHIDTPVYHLNRDSDERRLACLDGTWEDSDPKAFYKWFKNAVDSGERDQVRRLVRYLKAWAAVSFDDVPQARPTSIFLTVLVTESFKKIGTLTRFIGIDDDDALIEVVRNMHARLLEDKHVQNPASDIDENLNRMNAEAWDVFAARLNQLLDIAERADVAEDEAAAAVIWSEAFSFLMPLPEAEELEVVDEESGRAVMLLPEIEVQIFKRGTTERLATHQNEVLGVLRDRDLKFVITNPHVVPQFASVEWTVRNAGGEADEASDLGHRSYGLRQLSTDEHTAYAGKHYMDCVIRLHGQVHALRRVPVVVKDMLPAERSPVRNAPWRRIKTKRRR